MSEIQIKEISDKIKDFGVISINNFLDADKFDSANNVCDRIRTEAIKKGDKKKDYPVFLKNTFLKLIKFEFSKVKDSLVLKKIAEDLQLKKIAEQTFNSAAELHMMDSYFSEKTKELDLTNYWHCDNIFFNRMHADPNIEGASIKFFFYLNDVNNANGPFGYIPHSHHIVRALSSLILEKKIKYEAWWKLEDIRKEVSRNPIKNLIINKIGIEKLNIFLNNSKFLEEELEETNQYNIEMKERGVIIFDDCGFHRGLMPIKGNRLVLRYLYRKIKK